MAATILLIDNDDRVIDRLQQVIESGSTHSVLTSTDPRSALMLVDGHDVDVVVAGFGLTGMDTVDFMVEVRDRCPGMTFIIITGGGDREDVIRAVNEAGVFRFIRTPDDDGELTGVIDEAMEQRDTARELRRRCIESGHTYIRTLFRLATTSETFEPDTELHVLRIGLVCERLARLSGEEEGYCRDIRYAGMLHDIGKIGVPGDLLKRRGPLSKDEFETVKEHTLIGASLLRNPDTRLMEMAYEIALCHHEKFNGRGYPKGISGPLIPRTARIAAIADVFDTLLSERPYKLPFTPVEARQVFEAESGSHFDPELTSLLLDDFDGFLAIFSDLTTLGEEERLGILLDTGYQDDDILS